MIATMSQSFPARLHVLLASSATTGVVFRRGPSNAVCSILWNRRTDEFQLGQWLRARLYERRADISPDGRFLIYFARNSRWSSPTRGTWTAISRAPWLKAIVLFGKGDCWQGGGLFTSERRYWLNGCHFVLTDSKEVKHDDRFRPVGSYGAECLSVYYVRLQRCGWVLRDKLSAGITDMCTIFEKALPKGWTLRKYAHAQVGAPPGKGCYWDEHELESASHDRLQFPDWEWADLDRTRLVWAAGGCLYTARLTTKDMGEAKLLHDFNGMVFERRQAPY
jgi:hypothetical protein